MELIMFASWAPAEDVMSWWASSSSLDTTTEHDVQDIISSRSRANCTMQPTQCHKSPLKFGFAGSCISLQEENHCNANDFVIRTLPCCAVGFLHLAKFLRNTQKQNITSQQYSASPDVCVETNTCTQKTWGKQCTSAREHMKESVFLLLLEGVQKEKENLNSLLGQDYTKNTRVWFFFRAKKKAKFSSGGILCALCCFGRKHWQRESMQLANWHFVQSFRDVYTCPSTPVSIVRTIFYCFHGILLWFFSALHVRCVFIAQTNICIAPEQIRKFLSAKGETAVWRQHIVVADTTSIALRKCIFCRAICLHAFHQ